MSCELYEWDYLPSRSRRLTQADLRVSMLMAMIAIVAMNLIL